MKKFRFIDEKYLIWTIYALAGAVLLTPLITFSSFYFPFIVPRNIYFRIVVELLFFVYLILVLQNRSYLPKKNTLWLLLTSFIGLLTLSAFFGGTFVASFWSYYERMDGLFTLYHLLAFFFVVYGTFNHRKAFERLLQVSVFIAFMVACVGLSQLVGVNLLLASSGGARITSMLGNATYLAAYLLIHLFFALYFVIQRRGRLNLSLFAYGFIALDILLMYLHFKYGIQASGRQGIIGQILSDWRLFVPMLIAQAISLGYFWLKKKDYYQRYLNDFLYLMMSALFVLLIMTTQTRGALVGLAMAFTVACVLLIIRRKEKLVVRIGSGLAITLLIVATLLIFINRDSEFVQSNGLLNKVASISLTDKTTQTRLLTWQAGLRGVSEKPLLGWGMENFQIVFNEHFPTDIYTDEGTPLWFDRPHNILVQYLVEGGIMSLLLYLIFVTTMGWYLWRRVKNPYLGILFISFLVAYVGQNLFVFDSINSYVPFYLGLAFIVFLVSSYRNEENVIGTTVDKVLETWDSLKSPILPRTYAWGVLIVVAIGTVSLIWNVHFGTVRSNTSFVSAYNEQTARGSKNYSPELSEHIFKIIENSSYLGQDELLTSYFDHTITLLINKEVPRQELIDLVDGLERLYAQQSEVRQNSARFNMSMMNLYFHSTWLDNTVNDNIYARKLLAISEKTIPLSPTRTQIYYLTGRAHMILGEFDKGLADFQKAVELSPDIFEAQWNLMAAFLQVGDLESADETLATLQNIVEFDISTYARVISLYTATKHYSVAEELLRQLIEQSPDQPSLYVGLAEISAFQGKNQLAREAVNQAVSLDPSLTEEASKFLQALDRGDLNRS